MAKHILVTNDDGVFAPGLFALIKEMRKLGRVTVLAPDRNWSGGGHVKTLDRALRIKEVRLADEPKPLPATARPLIALPLPPLVISRNRLILLSLASMRAQILVMMSPIPGQSPRRWKP